MADDERGRVEDDFDDIEASVPEGEVDVPKG
jgi:hypothetical protein